MTQSVQDRSLPLWGLILLPIILLVGMLAFLFFGNPLALFRTESPPVEAIHFGTVRVVPEGFKVTLVNEGPDAVRISQVLVDEAYWNFEANPRLLQRYESSELTIYYPWVYGEPHEIRLITATGATFETEVELAVPTPLPGLAEFYAYGLLGVYVGIIPVGLGMLWFPALRRISEKWIDAVLALTVGLLFFLLVDTGLEGLEVAEMLPAFLQGVPLLIFAALVTWLVLLAFRAGKTAQKNENQALGLARLVAASIGLHNLGEGLAIGAAFALGEVALGSFLVIGFTLHNITEGIGIAAPLLPRTQGDAKSAENSPSVTLLTFIGLVLLAGGPAILGAWIGGFAYSPILSTLFLGIGVGAIWQVIVEVGTLLRRNAEQRNRSLVSWTNLAGFVTGLLLMYVTALLVSF